jgi:hypothetical protein
MLLNILKLNFQTISGDNFNAIEYLETHPTEIDWKYLSKNPNAIHLLEQNINNINWNALSFNENAIYLLEKNVEKINFTQLSKNRNIFCCETKINIDCEKQIILKKQSNYYVRDWKI